MSENMTYNGIRETELVTFKKQGNEKWNREGYLSATYKILTV